MNAMTQPPRMYDAVSIGFGPAAIAVACALQDAREAQSSAGALDVKFLERARETAWHPELVLDGTDINHSPFRDLVTPRNPQSRFSFAMYLKEKGRLFDFSLLGRPASRLEWSDYIAWVALQMRDMVSYGESVEEVLPGIVADRLDHVLLRMRDGVLATRNLIVSSGSTPAIPDVFVPHLGPRVFHTSEFLTRLSALGTPLPKRWMVIGSGQSASESTLELISRQEGIEVTSVHRSIGFRLTQLGQFPNQVFSPDHVDYFHGLGHAQRREYLDRSRAANYAGIDPDESQKLFSMIYEDRLQGRSRLQVQGYRDVVSISPAGTAKDVVLRDRFTGETSMHRMDGVVLATGYQQSLVPALLSNLQPWLASDDDGGLLVNRDYDVAMRESSDVRVIANGLSERSHGIGDGQSFSLMALRAERILMGLMAHRAAAPVEAAEPSRVPG
jgi:L-ornithine N5-oxygenase